MKPANYQIRRYLHDWQSVLIRVLLCGLTGVGILACTSGQSARTVDPLAQIRVTPSALSFGAVEVGASSTLSVTVENIGTADLDLTSVVVERADSGIFTLKSRIATSGGIAPGGSEVISVTYKPSSPGPATGILRLETNLAETPEVTVSLSGNGVAAPRPEISVPLKLLRYGEVEMGQSQTREMQISNIGTANLRVMNLTLEGVSSAEFSISTSPGLPLVMIPGAQEIVAVSYSPSQPGRHTASLRIITDDPSMPEVVVELEGTGVPVPVVSLSLLSAQTHLVSGGDALVQIKVDRKTPLTRLQVTLNGDDVTALFRPVTHAIADMNPIFRGLVSGLALGDGTLAVAVLDANQVPIPNTGAALTLSNWPSSGPLISGPHETPFFCQTEQFRIGPDLGNLGAPLDSNCSVKTRVDFLYRSTDGQFKALANPEERPADLAQTTTTTGERVPYIVRLETGTLNRAIYQTAVLAISPDAAPNPWQSAPGWNGRLVYKFGGGCRAGWYRQGERTDEVLDHMMLSQGFATASASLNVFGNNCNTLLAAETMMMVKERFIERNGLPQHTIGWGCSGGSYQAYFIADNYPGLLDGIIPQCSFPDVTFATTHTVSDAWLLETYFGSRANVAWTSEDQLAVTGFGTLGHLSALSQEAARIDPLPSRPGRSSAEFNAAVPSTVRYHPETNPTGARATIYDHTVVVYGREPDTGFARRPLDNVGIQYGLQALNTGQISTAQFLDLNERIGGFDRDATIIDNRTVADLGATRRAYESGQLLSGGGGLASMPILDIDVIYTDLNVGGDLHMKVHHFSTRERLRLTNGQSDNHVMWSGAGNRTSERLRQGLALMDEWLTRIRADTSDTAPVDKVVQNKPEGLTDGCWSQGSDAAFIEEPQEFGGVGTSPCNDLYPAFSSPRMVAGGPLANDIVKCQLKPIDLDDYTVAFTTNEVDRLYRIFPDGVCDWDQSGVEQRPLRGTWLSFGPSPVNLVKRFVNR